MVKRRLYKKNGVRFTGFQTPGVGSRCLGKQKPKGGEKKAINELYNMWPRGERKRNETPGKKKKWDWTSGPPSNVGGHTQRGVGREIWGKTEMCPEKKNKLEQRGENNGGGI